MASLANIDRLSAAQAALAARIAAGSSRTSDFSPFAIAWQANADQLAKKQKHSCGNLAHEILLSTPPRHPAR